MKKIILILSLTLSINANAGLMDTIMTSNLPTKETTSSYKLSTYGYDVRVYEWMPSDNENVRCVFVAGNKNSSGVACYQEGGLKWQE